jgi:hypothetical protein
MTIKLLRALKWNAIDCMFLLLLTTRLYIIDVKQTKQHAEQTLHIELCAVSLAIRMLRRGL